MRTLLTGAGGFLGQHVVRALSGQELHALGRRSVAGAKSWTADLGDAAAVRAVVHEVLPDVIVHLGAAGVTADGSTAADLMRVNAGGTTAVLEAAAGLPSPPVVVVAGSGFEYGPLDRPAEPTDPPRPTTPYALSKVAASHACELFGARLPVVLLRLFSLYGPGDRPPRIVPQVIRDARTGRPTDLTGCEQVRDYLYIADAAALFARVAREWPRDCPGFRVANVGSGRRSTLKEFLAKLSEILDQRGLRSDLRFGALPYRQGEAMCYAPSGTRTEALVGWDAATSLETGLRETVDHDLQQTR